MRSLRLRVAQATLQNSLWSLMKSRSSPLSPIRWLRSMIDEISFVHPNVSKKDRELFGFNEGDEHTIGHAVNSTTGDWMMCHLMHFAGIFPSVGIARKNGWNKPIPEGFSEFTVGKRKKKVWILNEIKDL